MKKTRLMLVVTIMVFILAQFCACSYKRSSPDVNIPNSDNVEQNSNGIPKEAMDAFRELLQTVHRSEPSLILKSEVCEKLSPGTNVYIIVSEWSNQSDSLYLPIVVYQEDARWTAVFLGEDSVNITDKGVTKIPKGVLQTFSLQGTCIRDGLLISAKASYVRSAFQCEQLSDSMGTDQFVIDLKIISDSDEAKWMFAVRDRNTPDKIYYGVDGRGKTAEKNELAFLFAAELSDDYELICGNLHVSGSDLLQVVEQ